MSGLMEVGAIDRAPGAQLIAPTFMSVDMVVTVSRLLPSSHAFISPHTFFLSRTRSALTLHPMLPCSVGYSEATPGETRAVPIGATASHTSNARS